MEPGFLLSYWRPWDENSSFIDSWGDYLRDTSLIDYGAEKIGKHIKDASREQIYAIENASRQQSEATLKAAEMQAMVAAKIGSVQTEAIQKAAKMIGYQLEDTKKELSFLNRRMDIIREQQRLGLMLQDNIAQLLKIPDSEKERQQAITLGIQFFVNATKDPDLFDDALEEFLKAEQMKKQDYFVLHRIGCIYLYSEKHLDIQKALDYFARAGKYASVESDPSAIRLSNLLTNSINGEYVKTLSDTDSIQFLAGDSYEKAALASYIFGDDEKAIVYQKKALSHNSVPENRFKLAKYLVRGGKCQDAIEQLCEAVEQKPEIIDAIINDVDTASETMMLDFVIKKGKEIDLALEESLDHLLEEQEDNVSFQAALINIIYNRNRYSYADRISLLHIVQGRTILGKSFSSMTYLKSSVYGEVFESINAGILQGFISRIKNGGHFFIDIYDKNHKQLPFQVVSAREFVDTLPKDVINRYSIDNMNMAIYYPLKQKSAKQKSFKENLFSKQFIEIVSSDDFVYYVYILSNDINEACGELISFCSGYFGLKLAEIFSLKLQIHS